MDITTVIAIVVPSASLVFGFLTMRRGQKLDDGTQGREMGQILTEIGYIKSSLDSINKKLEHSDERFAILGERVSKVEAAAASAHKRIDELDKGA
jgi:hypothetical protein